MKKTLYLPLAAFLVICNSYVLFAQKEKTQVLILILDHATINHLIKRRTEHLKKGQQDQTFIPSKFAIKKAKVISHKLTVCCSYIGDYVKGLKFSFKGLPLKKKLAVQHNLHWFYNNIATSYAELKNYDKSLGYSRKAPEIEQKLNDSYTL